MPEEKLHHIVRLDIDSKKSGQHGTHGWQVRVTRDGKRKTKFFADLKHGGYEEAKKRAVSYRDTLLASLPDPADGVERSREARASKDTGVPGLHLTRRSRETKSGQSQPVHPHLQVSWISDQGKRQAASFSIEKHGFSRALREAANTLARKNPHAPGDPIEIYQTAYAKMKSEFVAGS